MNIHEQHDIDSYFDFVYGLVKQSGLILLEAVNLRVDIKDNHLWDEVTQYDRRIEEVLIKTLKNKFPNHKFIGEEESSENGKIATLTDAPTWIIDPIDGTANFIRQFPITCISVGLTINKVQTIGIIFNPYLDEMYTAIKGRGAFLNGMRIYTSNQTDIKRALFNYEMSLAKNEQLTDLYMKRMPFLMSAINSFRSLGCAALGLCYVARGTTDAYQCDGLQPWDAAAGVLIVREAGGFVCDSSKKNLGEEFDLMNPNFLATSSEELSEQFVEVERLADNQ